MRPDSAAVRARGACRAFSLIELLLVVAILGIVTAVTLPQMSVALGGGRVRIAARTVAQSGRYARTMAILHQTERELVLDIEAKQIRVQAGGGDRAAMMEDALGLGLGRPSAPDTALDDDGVVRVDAGVGTVGVDTNAPLTGREFAEEIATEYTIEGVQLTFLGYDDTVDDGDGPGEQDEGSVTLRYHSNGTCRPYRVRVSEEGGGLTFVVVVDVVGGSRILTPEEQ